MMAEVDRRVAVIVSYSALTTPESILLRADEVIR
jgi:hypothetical protein